MVLMALRGANAVTAASAVVVPHSSAPEPVLRHAPAFDDGSIGASTLAEAIADSPAFEYESRPPIPFEELESAGFDLYKNEEPVERIQGVQTDSPARSENYSPQEPATVLEGFVPSTSTIDPEYGAVGESQPILQSAASEATVKSDFEAANIGEEHVEGPPSNGEEASADPWENPLAAWDYSRTEWPALEGATRKRSFNKKTSMIAAVVLIASAVGFYFLVFRPSDPPLAAATDNGTKAQASAAAPALSESPSRATARPAAETSNHDSSDRETTEVNGRFSLQAAAFATQDGADEFAEKLKQAGLASYVVPADIARRGRWYRVRVGRFDSEQSAQEFAAEAQRRARAAGIGVQLIVCQYGQP